MAPNYYADYTNSPELSIDLSLGTICPACGADVFERGCNCSPSDIIEAFSERGSQRTPPTSHPTSQNQPTPFDDDKIDPNLPELQPRVEFPVPTQPPQIPQPAVTVTGSFKQAAQGLNADEERSLSNLLREHGDVSSFTGDVTDMLSKNSPHVADHALGHMGGLFAPPSPNHLLHLAPPRVADRQPLRQRNDVIANRNPVLHSVPSQPEQSTVLQTIAPRRRAQPAPNPDRDERRKTGRAIQADTDPDMVCCNWDWMTTPVRNRHQRWHQEVPETSLWFCKLHRTGFLKQADYNRHIHSHVGTLRTWFMCPRFGTDGCHTWFGHTQNMGRHLKSKPHYMADNELIKLEVDRAKKDPSLQVQAFENPGRINAPVQ